MCIVLACPTSTFGDVLYPSNVGRIGGDVQQRWCEVLIAWVFGRVLEKDGIPFLEMLLLAWGMGMALGFCFGMTNGMDCGDSCLKYFFFF